MALSPYSDIAKAVVLVDKDTGVPYNAAASGGGAVTIADGADVAQGALADAAVTNPASSGSVIAFLKGILTRVASVLTTQTDGTQQTKVVGPNGVFNATCKGYQQITSLSSATALTVPADSKYCIIQTESQALRWRDDGTNPTATVGMRITTDKELYYDGNLAAIKLIEEAASAKANISYYA